MIVVDCETTPDNDLVIIGVASDCQYEAFQVLGHGFKTTGDYFYRYFSDSDSFYKFLAEEKIKEVFCHNLEFDFFKIFEKANVKVKFCGHYSTAGLSYIQQGIIIWKDLHNHLAFSLRHIGHLINIEKLEIDYKGIKELTPELIFYNQRDCLITIEALKQIEKIYQNEGMKKIKSTSGSQAMGLYLRKFFCANFKRIPKKDLDIWRRGYSGGWVEVFQQGAFTPGPYYKIDINSLFPFMMLFSLPLPYKFRVVSDLSKEERREKYWLGFTPEYDNYHVINSIEHQHLQAKNYYVFDVKVYPFVGYVKYLYAKKEQSTGLAKQIYKKLLNSLYGKFGQLSNLDMITNYKYRESPSIYYKEQIIDDLYRIKMTEKKTKFWVNVVWSLFITAKARQYMLHLYNYLNKQGFKVYYIDTDAFIISGDIKKIRHCINNDKIGLFKIEEMANDIDIRAKKMYRFGDNYKCKGVPEEFRKEFFENGYVQFEKFLRYKEGVKLGVSGITINVKKEDRSKKPLFDPLTNAQISL